MTSDIGEQAALLDASLQGTGGLLLAMRWSAGCCFAMPMTHGAESERIKEMEQQLPERPETGRHDGWPEMRGGMVGRRRGGATVVRRPARRRRRDRPPKSIRFFFTISTRSEGEKTIIPFKLSNSSLHMDGQICLVLYYLFLSTGTVKKLKKNTHFRVFLLVKI